ncbi:MAG: hypothetical protein IJ939_01605, partial [Clostridia bacterium]|nr:hypothetical protein [Clostridia bacterium]
NVKSPSSQHSNVTIDNGASVVKVNAYNEKVTVNISSLEENGQTYTLEEEPVTPLFQPEENDNPNKSIPASSAFVPPTAGLTIASYVVRNLI